MHWPILRLPSNADSTSTDSTGVVVTNRGAEITISGDGRATFKLEFPVGIKDGGADVDSLMIGLSGGIGPISAGIEIAIPLHPIYPQPDPTPQPNEVEYDYLGRKLTH